MMGFRDGSGISWTVCKQSAPRSRQITTSTPQQFSSMTHKHVLSVKALKALLTIRNR